MRCLLVCFLQQICFASFSQTTIIENLRHALYTSDNDKKKLSTLFLLCDEANSMPLDSLHLYYSQANAIAKKENSTRDIIQTNLYKAIYLTKKGKVDSAESVIDSSVMQLANNDPSLKFRFLILKSNVLIRADKQKESMDNSLKLLSEAENVHDELAQARAKNNIGWAYMELGQNRDALNWFFKAMEQEKKFPANNRQPYIYSNIAAVYNNININDSAEAFAQMAINLAKKKNDLSYLANAYFIYAGLLMI